MSARLFFAALLAAFAVAGSALGAPPFDEEFQVNTYTTSFQTDPAIAVDANGGFVVVWGSYGSAGSDDDLQSVQGQRYAADGSVIDLQFQVNTYTTGAQSQPSLAVEADGGFVVVWSSDGNGGDDADQSIQAQRYDATGSPVSGEFQVNTYTTNAQQEPAVAAHADGAFVVVWSSNGSAGSDSVGYSIQGQRYDASGGSLDGEFEVNTFTTSDQRRPSVAVEADGDFLIVWQSLGSSEGDTDGFSIQAQRYQSGGDTVGDQFQVNTYTTSTQAGVSLGIDADGGFVVVWESFGSSEGDTDGFSIQAQRYQPGGNAMGVQFQVNTTTPSEQRRPAVGVAPDGTFVVAWDSIGSTGDDTSAYSLQSQRYDASGGAVGSEFQVNTTTTANQAFSAVAAIEDGVFSVVWRSNESGCDDSDSASIQGQLFGASASAPGITLNAPCLFSELDIFADSDDVFPSSIDTLHPTGRNFNDSHQVTEEASSTDASYDFSPPVLDIRFDHARGTTGVVQTGFDPIFFTVGEDDFYTLEGVYTAVDSEGGNIVQAMELIDVTDAVSLFVGVQQSEMTPNESFTLGRQEGDLDNTLEGSRTGALVAGHVYRLQYIAFIQADSETTQSATASGFFRLSLGATAPVLPAGVPALGPTSLMLLATLLAAAAIYLLRPQEARTTR